LEFTAKLVATFDERDSDKPRHCHGLGSPKGRGIGEISAGVRGIGVENPGDSPRAQWITLVQTLIALFRGINVGGKNSLPMKELVEILKELGCRNVKTYIQSGNAVFQTKEKNTARLSTKVSAAIKKRRGFEPFVLLLEAAELEMAIAGNPFPEGEAEHKTLHIGFLECTPKCPDLKAVSTIQLASERFHLADCFFYLYAPAGIGQSKLAERAERLLGVAMTMRNWRTVCKIKEMVSELDK
jgi:uncharacterized protein (DUF1697 family)